MESDDGLPANVDIGTYSGAGRFERGGTSREGQAADTSGCSPGLDSSSEEVKEGRGAPTHFVPMEGLDLALGTCDAMGTWHDPDILSDFVGIPELQIISSCPKVPMHPGNAIAFWLTALVLARLKLSYGAVKEKWADIADKSQMSLDHAVLLLLNLKLAGHVTRIFNYAAEGEAYVLKFDRESAKGEKRE